MTLEGEPRRAYQRLFDLTYPAKPPVPAWHGSGTRLLANVVEPASISSPKHLPVFGNPDRTFDLVLNFILPAAIFPGGGYIKALRDTDVRELLSGVSSPTMLLRRRNDRAVRVEAGHDMARQISGAHFVELDGNDHWFFAGDQRPRLNAIERFIRGLPGDRRHRR